jgi:acetylornithine deacetylase/succinyl-diaminopimelate desuccinylase-like protein
MGAPLMTIEEALIDQASRFIEIEGHEELDVYESRVVQYLQEFADKHNLHFWKQEIQESRYNFLIEVDSGQPGPHIVLNGHMDTVPPGGMREPFKPRLEEGKLYGRGAVDMKGFLSVMCQLLLEAKDHLAEGKLTGAFTAGEETYSPGMYKLASVLDADFVIVGEPTQLRIGTAHKGVTWLQADFYGKAAHGSVPHKGHSALYDAAAWIQAIESNYEPLLEQKHDNLLGQATINLGQISGGVRPVTVPSHCRIQFERRLLPGETPDAVLDDLRTLTAEVAMKREKMQAHISEMNNFHGVPHGPLKTNPENPFVKKLQQAASDVTNEIPSAGGLPFWTDGALVQTFHPDVAVVIFGPGDIAQAHSDEEWISVRQLSESYRILEKFLFTKGG